MSITTVNPATGEPIKTYEFLSDNEVSQVIDDVHTTFLKWRNESFATRKKLMLNAAKVLRKNNEEYAKVITEEMGKSITSARGEVEKCAWVCEYYAEQTEEFLKPHTTKTDMSKSYVTYQPLGVIFAIMPWNFPFWQVMRFAAPNLMAGNAAILKHAPISSGAALALESMFREAGFPEHLFRTVIMDDIKSDDIIDHKNIRGVTLTGSGRTGEIVGSRAGRALKKVVLELGGSDPYLIMEDADLEMAAEVAIKTRFAVTGQVCISPKRIIVQAAVWDAFNELAIKFAKEFIPADPMKDDTNMGPMSRDDLRANVHRQVQESIQNGAKCLLGGDMPEGKGFYYPPTVLTNVAKGQAAFDEEIFGPVVALIKADSEAHAIEMANDSPFGLGGAVFTKDIKRGEKIALQIEAGTVCVNTNVGSDPRLPFGGIKDSGIGRELAPPGVHEFTNIKTISIK